LGLDLPEFQLQIAAVLAGYVNGFVIEIRAKMILSWNLRM